jgi:hypothetical protein
MTKTERVPPTCNRQRENTDLSSLPSRMQSVHNPPLEMYGYWSSCTPSLCHAWMRSLLGNSTLQNLRNSWRSGVLCMSHAPRIVWWIWCGSFVFVGPFIFVDTQRDFQYRRKKWSRARCIMHHDRKRDGTPYIVERVNVGEFPSA